MQNLNLMVREPLQNDESPQFVACRRLRRGEITRTPRVHLRLQLRALRQLEITVSHAHTVSMSLHHLRTGISKISKMRINDQRIGCSSSSRRGGLRPLAAQRKQLYRDSRKQLSGRETDSRPLLTGRLPMSGTHHGLAQG